jgi:hypothetical protein
MQVPAFQRILLHPQSRRHLTTLKTVTVNASKMLLPNHQLRGAVFHYHNFFTAASGLIICVLLAQTITEKSVI